MSKLSIRKAAAVPCLAFVMLLFYLHPAKAAEQADMATVVSVAAEIIYDNEGSYDSVNPDDNGAVSIGKLQWHGKRALSLLQTIAAMNTVQAKKLLGTELYEEIEAASSTSLWTNRKLDVTEAMAVKKLLASSESKEAQDTLAVTDITSYITQAKRLGIANEAALVYFADLTNQGGSGASARVAAAAAGYVGKYAAITLNDLHLAAICDSVMGHSAYQGRRFHTYIYVTKLGWTYCSEQDSFIPDAYLTAREKGAAWMQRSLNACMEAGLNVTGTYDDETKQAVMAFQEAERLTADGVAGRSTIVALMKLIFTGGTVTPGKPADPESPIKPTDPEDPESPINPIDPANPEVPADPVTPIDPADPANPEVPEVPLKETVLKTSRTSYAVNDTHKPFRLRVTSSHSQSPVTYRSSDASVVTVDESGQVTVKGAGQAQIIVAQAKTDTYRSAQLTIAVEIYSTNPSDYPVPKGALYAEKKMNKQYVRWLQAALFVLDKAEVTVDGVWSETMTKAVTDFQKKCGLEADGIAGTMTQDIVKKLLAVKTEAPVLTAKSGENAVTIYWEKSDNADRIYIYRKEKGGTYKRIKTAPVKRAGYKDATAKKGVTYYYVAKYGLLQNKVKAIGPSSKGVVGKPC